jgi:hypothetical protein
VIVLFGVRETRPAELASRESLPVGERLRALWHEPVLLAFTGLALLFGTIYAQAHVTLPVDMSANGLTPEQYGLAIAINGALIVVLGLPASNAAPRWPRYGAMAVAGILLGVGFGLPAIVTTFAGYALSVMIWTLGEIAGATVAPSIVADRHRSTNAGCTRACSERRGAWRSSPARFWAAGSTSSWDLPRCGPRAWREACSCSPDTRASAASPIGAPHRPAGRRNRRSEPTKGQPIRL